MAGVRRYVEFVGPRHVEVRRESMPSPSPGEVVVETEVSSISAGTELLIYRGEAPAGMPLDLSLPALEGDLKFPLRYGYSCVGRVVELGPGVAGEWRERRVFAFEPHASHFVAPIERLQVVPDGVEPERAAFLPAVETAVSLVMDAVPVIGERVVVLGQGIVGLITTALLAQLALTRTVTADVYARRRSLSVELGADLSLDPTAPGFVPHARAAIGDKPSHDGATSGADLTIELSGNPAALDQAIALTGDYGRILVGSWYGTRKADVDLGSRFHRSGIEIRSSQVSRLAPRWTSRWTKERRLAVAWDFVQRLPLPLLVSHRFPVDSVGQAYRMLDEMPSDALQVLLRYD